ncbi:MAG: two-component system sensor histidine kinase NtrB [Candidatus Kapaibacterium sp.]
MGIFSKRSAIAMAAILIMGIVTLAFVLFEIRLTSNDLTRMLKNESVNLVHSLKSGIRNNYLASNQIQESLLEKMNTAAAIIEDILPEPDRQALKKITENADLESIVIINNTGAITGSSIQPKNKNVPSYFLDNLKNILGEEYKWAELGDITNPVSGEISYSLVRRAGSRFILVSLNKQKILGLRRNLGIGRLIIEFARNPDINYIALQDTLGIYTAAGISELEPIRDDTFLRNAFAAGGPMHRQILRNDTELLETTDAISLEDSRFLIRIALSMERISEIRSTAILRSVLVGAGIFLTGSLLIIFVTTRRRMIRFRGEKERAESYLSTLLDNINDAVIAVNNQYKLIAINSTAAALFAIDQNEAAGKSYQEIFPEDEALIKRSLDKNAPQAAGLLSFTNNNNEKKIIAAGVSFLKNDKNETEAAISIIRDITKEKEAEEQLRRGEKLSAMGQLAAGVAHEIRNPLNSINIIAQRFEYEFEPEEDKSEYYRLVKTVRSEVARVNRIISQFLEFARPSSLELKDISIKELIEKSLNLMDSRAAEKGINIEAKTDDLLVRADEDKLRQVMINLIQNSIEAMDKGGKIYISSEKKGNETIIKIQDTGPGIPENNLPKIFNHYFSTKKQGTGLGLSIVNKIINDHGGSIKAGNTKSGAEFVISLPFRNDIDEND